MRWVTAGLGALTVLTVAAALTPSGQAVLGAAPPAAPLTVVADAPGPAGAQAAVPRRERAAAVRARPPVLRRPAAAPAARPARPPRPAAPTPELGQVASILLSLPQVLSQAESEEGQVRPAPDRPPVPRVWRDRWAREHRADDEHAGNR